ncbi:MAG: hypothetical protein ABJK39_14645 [Hyphomicrobiales bacterium]
MKFINQALIASVVAGLWLTGVTSASAQKPPSLDDIHWYLSDSFCSFSRENHTFNYDDPESWRYIFMTGFPNDQDGELGYARIDGRLRELQETERFKADGFEIIVYKTWDKNPYTVTVARKAGAGSQESTNYTGNILVERNGVGHGTSFKGDCGV